MHIKKWMVAYLKKQTAGLYSRLGNKDESIIVHPNTIIKKKKKKEKPYLICRKIRIF